MKEKIRHAAYELGFILCGFTDALPVGCAGHLDDAIGSGRTADMKYLARDPIKRCDPRSLMPDANSVICCAYPYRFARGRDYHDIVRNKLKALWKCVLSHAPDAKSKFCVDTSPIMEKALAERAGLGWIGKHSVLVNAEKGSFFVLGEIITDLALEPDASAQSLCKDCRACLDACPTSALKAPYVLDSRRCISYLTIELQGQMPYEMERFVGGGQYGCEACQLACPYNKKES